MGEELFEHEIPQSLCKDGIRTSNYTLAQKLKLLNSLIDQLLWCYQMIKKVRVV